VSKDDLLQATAQLARELELKTQALTQRLARAEVAISGLAMYLHTLSPRAKQDMAKVFDGGLYLDGGVLSPMIKADARKLLKL